MKAICPTSTPTLKKNKAVGNMILWQAKFAERAGKSEPVEQAECESHDPWSARRDANLPLPQTNYFEGHENDRKGDRGFNRPRWNMNETEGRERESNTVRNGKGRHCFQQPHGPVGDNQQGEDKKKMIDAKTMCSIPSNA